MSKSKSKSICESDSESIYTRFCNNIYNVIGVIDNNKLRLEKEKEASSRTAASSTIGDHIRAFTTRNRYNEMKKSSKSILEDASDKLESLVKIVKDIVDKNKGREGLESYVESYVKLELDNIFKSIGIKSNDINELYTMNVNDIVAKEEIDVYNDKNDEHLNELNGILKILADNNSKNIEFKENDDGSFSFIITTFFYNYKINYKNSHTFLDYIRDKAELMLSMCGFCTKEIRKILNNIKDKVGNDFELFKSLIKTYLKENKEKSVNNKNALNAIEELEKRFKNVGGKYSKAKKKPPTKKPPAKKPPTKKPPTKKPAAKKPAAKKPAVKKAPAKKPPTKKPAAKKPVAKKPVAKKTPVKK